MRDYAIKVSNVSKLYNLYNSPRDRFKEALSITHKKYRKEFYALKDISFEVKKGECVGVVGRNGAGKSTILKILTGVLTPTSGIIDIIGKCSALLELGAGFNMDYTGMENIYLNGAIMGYTHQQMEERVGEILEFADIGDFINQPVKSYSSGMFVRLAFSVAISVEPEILIVDEALAVGDTRFQLKCMDKFKELRDRGITILFVSHDINAIKRFCDRTIWLNKGEIVDDGETDLVCDRYLDFLKLDDSKGVIENYDKDIVKKEDVSEELNNIDIASIRKVNIFNSKQEQVDTIRYGETVNIEIQYLVSDISIKKPVIGVAIYNYDNEYICGLNTLLDEKAVKWEFGLNRIILRYNKFNLIGGSYYFDVAIYDETATVAIDYRAKFMNFFVKSKYVGEGIVILDHVWN